MHHFAHALSGEGMPILFHPKAGMVLICDFRGFQEPEMVKRRPVVIVSPNHLARPGLVTVVPLSTTTPNPIFPYHHRVKGSPVPGSSAADVWAKCNMVVSVSCERLDRVKLGRGAYQCGYVSAETVRALRRCAALSLGLELPWVAPQDVRRYP